jgi:polyisoprenyl-phosphate glycosyltransferase
MIYGIFLILERKMQADLSIVVPIYNEEFGIVEFAKQLKVNLDQLRIQYEVIFINDGSSDATQDKIDSIKWSELKSFEFQFNAGHMKALEAGYEKSSGKLIITMDSDLQHPPKYIKHLIEKQKETNADVVYGIRDSRKEDSLFKRLTAKFYYSLMRRLSGINIRTNAADFRLITKHVRDTLVELQEENKVFRLLIPSLGYKESEVLFQAEKRIFGSSKYGIKDMGLLAISSVLSFSIRPLRWAIWIGLWAVILSLVWISYVIVAQFEGWVIQGWSSLIAAVILFAGVQLLLLGLVGQYIGQIYVSQQKRPKYLFKNK